MTAFWNLKKSFTLNTDCSNNLLLLKAFAKALKAKYYRRESRMLIKLRNVNILQSLQQRKRILNKIKYKII